MRDISLSLSYESMLCVLIKAILMSKHPYQYNKKSLEIIPNTIMSATMGFFVRDSRTSSK